MNHPSEIDFLIVGQGLAGSAVAMRALDLHYTILVMDQPAQNHSSVVAAGLFNPVTGRNLVKTWLADEIFPFMDRYYRNLERLMKARFLYAMPVYRPFRNIEEQNEWMAKSADADYRDYISDISAFPVSKGEVNDPFGGITLRQSGYLDVKAYLSAVRRCLEDRKAFSEEAFDAARLQVAPDHVRYEAVSAKRIIFCQGTQNVTNPWFSYVPILSLKGESLAVQSDRQKNVILNRGVYMVPGARKNTWRVGSTYDREDRTPGCTPGARKELIRKLEDLIRFPYAVTGQEWGMRPVTPDRKPVLGRHPEHESMIIFNGLGTKGVSLAPYFSEVLFRWMGNMGTIHKEADVTRFN